ncbi:unnamed protein product, partial [Prorocentrum cordatum]
VGPMRCGRARARASACGARPALTAAGSPVWRTEPSCRRPELGAESSWSRHEPRRHFSDKHRSIRRVDYPWK